MIIVKLMGGLGNQMFQYALARHLAEIRKTQLKLDLSFLLDRSFKEGFTFRDYELGVFNIQENFCTPSDIEKINKKPNNSIKNMIHNVQRKMNPFAYVKEESFTFKPAVLNAPENSYLDGYWHSEKYFKNIEKIIRKEFTIKNPPTGDNKIFAEKILATNSISIHVRRADYVTNSQANQFHGTSSIDYYNNSIQLLSTKISQPHFYIFSDDIQWVKENISINFPTTYIDHNQGSKSFEDLRLMSLCKHNVIANSSFSWWGAWLNNNADKIVITPKKWFNNNQIKTEDLIPNNWLKI